MTFRVTDLMIEAAAKKSPKKPAGKPGPCTRCTQCTRTGMSTCTSDTGDQGCTDCKGDPVKNCNARALAGLHAQLRETLMAQAQAY